MLCESVFSSNLDFERAKSYYVSDGQTFLTEISDASERTFDDCSQTEMFDPSAGLTPLIDNEIIMLGVYPNPFDKEITVQYNSSGTDKIKLTLSTINGKTEQSFYFIPEVGLNYLKLNGESLEKGNYIISVEMNGNILSKKVIHL